MRTWKKMLLFSDNIPVIKIKVQPKYLKIWLHLQNNYQIILYYHNHVQYIPNIKTISTEFCQHSCDLESSTSSNPFRTSPSPEPWQPFLVNSFSQSWWNLPGTSPTLPPSLKSWGWYHLAPLNKKSGEQTEQTGQKHAKTQVWELMSKIHESKIEPSKLM